MDHKLRDWVWNLPKHPCDHVRCIFHSFRKAISGDKASAKIRNDCHCI